MKFEYFNSIIYFEAITPFFQNILVIINKRLLFTFCQQEMWNLPFTRNLIYLLRYFRNLNWDNVNKSYNIFLHDENI